MATHHKPPTFTAVTPYLTTQGADDLIAFLQKVFDAQLVNRHTDENGRVAHATVRIDDAVLEVSEANDTWKAMPLALHVYVPDVDADRTVGVAQAGGLNAWIAGRVEAGAREVVIEPLSIRYAGESLALRS